MGKCLLYEPTELDTKLYMYLMKVIVIKSISAYIAALGMKTDKSKFVF